MEILRLLLVFHSTQKINTTIFSTFDNKQEGIDNNSSIFCFRLSLEVMTLNPICENVETAQGVPLTVTGVAQVIIQVYLYPEQFWTQGSTNFV